MRTSSLCALDVHCNWLGKSGRLAWSSPGSNRGPFACEANVIATTPLDQLLLTNIISTQSTSHFYSHSYQQFYTEHLTLISTSNNQLNPTFLFTLHTTLNTSPTSFTTIPQSIRLIDTRSLSQYWNDTATVHFAQLIRKPTVRHKTTDNKWSLCCHPRQQTFTCTAIIYALKRRQ